MEWNQDWEEIRTCNPDAYQLYLYYIVARVHIITLTICACNACICACKCVGVCMCVCVFMHASLCVCACECDMCMCEHSIYVWCASTYVYIHTRDGMIHRCIAVSQYDTGIDKTFNVSIYRVSQ